MEHSRHGLASVPWQGEHDAHNKQICDVQKALEPLEALDEGRHPRNAGSHFGHVQGSHIGGCLRNLARLPLEDAEQQLQQRRECSVLACGNNHICSMLQQNSRNETHHRVIRDIPVRLFAVAICNLVGCAWKPVTGQPRHDGMAISTVMFPGVLLRQSLG